MFLRHTDITVIFQALRASASEGVEGFRNHLQTALQDIAKKGAMHVGVLTYDAGESSQEIIAPGGRPSSQDLKRVRDEYALENLSSQ